MPRGVLTKLSGDVLTSPGVIEFHRDLALWSHLSSLIGGGTQINQLYRERGWPIEFHLNGSRIVRSQEHFQVCKEGLVRNAEEVRQRHARANISIQVIIPIVPCDGESCGQVSWCDRREHYINGDQYVREHYHEYRRTFIITLQDRYEKKASDFARFFPYIQVRCF